jgi:hypothetical protein
MEPTQTVPHGFIDNPVIDQGRFPTHPADHADGFHTLAFLFERACILF